MQVVRVMLMLVCCTAITDDSAELAAIGHAQLMLHFRSPMLHARQAARERMFAEHYADYVRQLRRH